MSETFTFTRAEIEAHEKHVERLENEIHGLKATVSRLRRDLADPPGDVQEAVLKKLGLWGKTWPQ